MQLTGTSEGSLYQLTGEIHCHHNCTKEVDKYRLIIGDKKKKKKKMGEQHVILCHFVYIPMA